MRHLRTASAALALIVLGTAVAPSPARGVTLPPDRCRWSPHPVAHANLLMRDTYQFKVHPAVRLPHDLRWDEDAGRDTNWRFYFHSLMFIDDLLTGWRLTGNTAFRDRALVLAHDWHHDNPRQGAPSPWSWGDHATAQRAIVLACFYDLGLRPAWLKDALLLHGRTLASSNFYVRASNHALNQAIGLLEIGRVVGRRDWEVLARDRIAALLRSSVDRQGVSNEQSVYYQLYNWQRYVVAGKRLQTLGLAVPAVYARLRKMPQFLAHATLPDGRYEMLGDTDDRNALSIPGTVNEFAATAGKSGPRPSTTVAWYDAGYVFARTGWGERRAAEDETFMSLRFGPGVAFHGHPDGGALTLFGYGSRLLVDPGKYRYAIEAGDVFFRGRTGHNIVTVDGVPWRRNAGTSLLRRATTSTMVHARLRLTGHPGVSYVRTVTFSRRIGFVLVEDRLSSATARTFRQRWHLVHDAAPVISRTSVVTERARGNLLIRQLIGRPKMSIRRGQTHPIEGWISYRYGTKVAAPTVIATRHGTSVRYLTLLVPSAGRPNVRITQLRVTPAGYAVTVTVNGESERVVVGSYSAEILGVPSPTLHPQPARRSFVHPRRGPI